MTRPFSAERGLASDRVFSGRKAAESLVSRFPGPLGAALRGHRWLHSALPCAVSHPAPRESSSVRRAGAQGVQGRVGRALPCGALPAVVLFVQRPWELRCPHTHSSCGAGPGSLGASKQPRGRHVPCRLGEVMSAGGRNHFRSPAAPPWFVFGPPARPPDQTPPWPSPCEAQWSWETKSPSVSPLQLAPQSA